MLGGEGDGLTLSGGAIILMHLWVGLTLELVAEAFRAETSRAEDEAKARQWWVGGRTASGEERHYRLGLPA